LLLVVRLAGITVVAVVGLEDTELPLVQVVAVRLPNLHFFLALVLPIQSQ
jgi:hypothetical protein